MPPGHSPGAIRRVLVFDGETDPALIKVLDQLNYRADQPRTRSIEFEQSAECPIAVIVSDAIEAPLELCRALSPVYPVILLSDEESFALRLAAAEAGISALIKRPVNPHELSEWLEYFADRACPETVSVLIVDDDWLTAELNAEVLRASGMTVRTVNDPSQALQFVEDVLPDLILMDMQMPGVDGVRLAQIIRQSRQLFSLPIIFLSAERDETRQLMARRFGGDDFIAKPVDPAKLISVVRLRADRSKSLRALIERDRLTGLYDHSRFKERLSHELERCRRTGAEISLAMIDIDHFKQVNDRFGHPTGDTIIRTLSRALTTGLRRIDIVGRYGGEEFGVILLDTGPQSARMVIDRLRQRFDRLAFDAGGRQFSVSFSAGIASSRDHMGLTELVDAADRALYEAKRGGRDRVELAGLCQNNEQTSETLRRIEARGAADCVKEALQ